MRSEKNLSRRDFLKAGATAGAGAFFASLFGGGCNEEYSRQVGKDLTMTAVRQGVVSGVRTEIEGSRSQDVIVNVGGSQTQRNVVKTPEGSYFVITPNGINYTVVPGLKYGKYVEEHKEEFPSGYFVRWHDASIGPDHMATCTDSRFQDLSRQ